MPFPWGALFSGDTADDNSGLRTTAKRAHSRVQTTVRRVYLTLLCFLRLSACLYHTPSRNILPNYCSQLHPTLLLMYSCWNRDIVIQVSPQIPLKVLGDIIGNSYCINWGIARNYTHSSRISGIWRFDP